MVDLQQIVDTLASLDEDNAVNVITSVLSARPELAPPVVNFAVPDLTYPPAKCLAERRSSGVIKSYNEEKGYGFIACQELQEVFGNDVFLHSKQNQGGYKTGQQVSFAVVLNKDQKPQAFDLQISYGKGGKGGGGGMMGGGDPMQQMMMSMMGGCDPMQQMQQMMMMKGGMGDMGGMGGMGGMGMHGNQGQVDSVDREALMLCQGLLAQAEPIQSLGSGWIHCQSPRGVFYFNRQRLQISMQPPQEVLGKNQAWSQPSPEVEQPQQPRLPQPPMQQQAPVAPVMPDQNQTKTTVRSQIGDWAICMDQQGEFYYHFPTSQSYDRPPPELVQYYQEQKAQQALEQQRQQQQIPYQPQQQSMPYSVPDTNPGLGLGQSYGGYPAALPGGDLDMPHIRQY